MKRKILEPEHILVPGEYEIGNETILKIYFRIFDKLFGEGLPPAIVVKENLEDYKNSLIKQLENLNSFEYVHLPWEDYHVQMTASGAIKKIEEIYSQIRIDRNFSYYLIDGDHKSIAATLAHQPIYALELENDNDLLEIRKMVEKGELFNFNRHEKKLSSLVRAFNDFCFGNKNYVKTIKERVDELILNKDLPQYMRDRYKKSSSL